MSLNPLAVPASTRNDVMGSFAAIGPTAHVRVRVLPVTDCVSPAGAKGTALAWMACGIRCDRALQSGKKRVPLAVKQLHVTRAPPDAPAGGAGATANGALGCGVGALGALVPQPQIVKLQTTTAGIAARRKIGLMIPSLARSSAGLAMHSSDRVQD